MMFQKTFTEAGALYGDSQASTSNMNTAQVGDSFARLRRQHTARLNRSTASCGMFYRKSPVYRHV